MEAFTLCSLGTKSCGRSLFRSLEIKHEKLSPSVAYKAMLLTRNRIHFLVCTMKFNYKELKLFEVIKFKFT